MAHEFPWAEIDLSQLPIPDWGLHCPGCRYRLCGLTQYRCPECGCEFQVGELITTWTELRPPHFDGDERPLPDFGLHCAACAAELAGAGGDNCPDCGEHFDLPGARPGTLPEKPYITVPSDLFGPLPHPLVVQLLKEAQIPFLVRQELPIRKIVVGAGLESPGIHVQRGFYLDLLFVARRQALERVAARARSGQVWNCPACGEEVPGDFEVCWNCGSGPRDSDL